MTTDKPITNIAICCSGNTCRSPILAVWLERVLPKGRINIWTAGTNVSKRGLKKPLAKEAMKAAKAKSLERELLKKLEKHKSRSLWTLTAKPDILVWISDPAKVEGRIQKIRTYVDKHSCVLYIIPEKDDAWEAKNNQDAPEIIYDKYYEQAIRLKSWVKQIVKIIRR